MELLRWQVGDATVFRIGDVDATPALLGLIPKFDPAAAFTAAWLTPNFIDEIGRLRGSVQAFLIMIGSRMIIVDPGVGNGKRRTAVPGSDNLRTDFADAHPGHTPHPVSVMIESRGLSAVITGDVMHHPCQIAYPDWGASDFDPDRAQASRSDLIERFADSDTLIIGTHFANPVAGRIRREGTTFRLAPTDGLLELPGVI